MRRCNSCPAGQRPRSAVRPQPVMPRRATGGPGHPRHNSPPSRPSPLRRPFPRRGLAASAVAPPTNQEVGGCTVEHCTQRAQKEHNEGRVTPTPRCVPAGPEPAGRPGGFAAARLAAGPPRRQGHGGPAPPRPSTAPAHRARPPGRRGHPAVAPRSDTPAAAAVGGAWRRMQSCVPDRQPPP